MTIDSNKTWIPVGRRHEQTISLVDAYSEVMDALCWADGKCPVPVVDTIIFNQLGFQYYSFDWPQQRLLAMENLPSPNAALKTFMSMDEGNCISAVWMFEVKDSKGYLICVEYLNLQTLSNFFQNGDVKKVGVLQRYIYPRPFRLVDDVAQEVIVHFVNGRQVEVERRLGNHPLDSFVEHPTVRGNLFHPIPTFGKLSFRQQPFNSSECHYGLQGEQIHYVPFVHTCKAAADFISSALERYRRVGNGLSRSGAIAQAQARPVSTMTLQMRQSVHDCQLYFVGVLALRHPADRFHADVQYEFVKTQSEGVIYIQTPLSPGELVISALSPGHSNPSNTAPELKSPTDGEEDEEDEDDPNRYSPHRRPADPSLFTCPNCDSVQPQDQFVRMGYGEIVQHILSQLTSKAIGANSAQKLLRPGPPVADTPYANSRPKSAIHVTRAAPTPRQLISLISGSDVPPVLSRLRIPLADLIDRPIRLARSTPLCHDCAKSFGAVIVDNHSRPISEGQVVASKHSLDSFRSRPRSASPPQLRKIHTEPSVIADQIVLTPLQEHHRLLRRAERVKHDMIAMEQQSARTTAEKSRAESDVARCEAEVDSLLTKFVVREHVHADGIFFGGEILQPTKPLVEVITTTPDVPLCFLLQNDLYRKVVSALAASSDASSHGAADEKSSGCGLLWNVSRFPSIPQPSVVVAHDCLDANSVRHHDQVVSSCRDGRKTAWSFLKMASTTFGDLSDDERLLLCDVIGNDPSRALGIDEYA